MQAETSSGRIWSAWIRLDSIWPTETRGVAANMFFSKLKDLPTTFVESKSRHCLIVYMVGMLQHSLAENFSLAKDYHDLDTNSFYRDDLILHSYKLIGTGPGHSRDFIALWAKKITIHIYVYYSRIWNHVFAKIICVLI